MLQISGTDRTWSFCHWDNSPNDLKLPIRYVQDTTYKLYDDAGYPRFYNMKKDIEEKKPIADSSLSETELATKIYFESILQQMHN